MSVEHTFDISTLDGGIMPDQLYELVGQPKSDGCYVRRCKFAEGTGLGIDIDVHVWVPNCCNFKNSDWCITHIHPLAKVQDGLKMEHTYENDDYTGVTVFISYGGKWYEVAKYQTKGLRESETPKESDSEDR